MYIRFLGARGSISTPGKETVKYGGNTSCIEIRCGKEIFILDAGSGIRELGNKIMSEKPQHINILFSHFHWDHIQGFPFFAPVFNSKYSITLIGESKMNLNLEPLFSAQLMFPYFPLSLSELDAKIGFYEMAKNDSIKKSDVNIKLARLNHPGGDVSGIRMSTEASPLFMPQTLNISVVLIIHYSNSLWMQMYWFMIVIIRMMNTLVK